MKINFLTYTLAIIFLASGAAKLAGLEFELVAFERWGYPLYFMYFIGTAEVLGGLALALDILRKYAAPSLALLMLGAVGTHLIHQEWIMLIIALSIFIGCIFLAKTLWQTPKA